MFMRTKIYVLLLALLAMPLAVFAKPERVPAFGPNGTHWPELIPTPFMYDNTVANIIEVPCTWAAIKSALQGVTANQANSGTLILVQPGELTGNGSSSGSVPVLESIGSTSWSQRVTVAPRDGYGTVTWKNGVRFLKVYGICFAGFESTGISGIKMQGCSRSALAWIKCTGHFGIYGTAGYRTEGIEAVEVVQPTHYVVSDDSADFYAGGGGFDGWRFDGCYHAPRFFEYPYTGGKPHTDTAQFAAAGGGDYSNVTFRDSVYFSSNNCAIQTGNINGLTVEKCYVASAEVSLSRYPFLSGGATEGVNNAFNGSGQNMRAIDSVIYGGMAINTSDTSRPWSFASNTRTNKTYGSSNQPLSGAWTPNLTQAEAMSLMPPMPTDSYLDNIWKNPGATTEVSRPVFIPTPGIYNSPQQVSMTCSTANSTIYYTLDGSTPTTSSTRFTGPFTVSTTTTIKAFATSTTSGLAPSRVATGDYSIVNQVEKPVISPSGGQFSTPQPVTLTCPTAGASIYYSLDGSIPTSSSTLYTGPVLISTTSTLKAVGVKAGAENSVVASAGFGIGEAYIASEAWTNVTIPVQTSKFTVRWNAIPDGSQIDGVTGLSLGSVDNYTDLACIVRFAINGVIDARNGGAYQAANSLTYTAGKIYRFELTVDLAAKTYSATVTPDGGTAVQIANNYRFRNEQATVSTLDNLALVALDGGSHTISDIVFGTSAAPTAPQGLRVLSSP